MKEIQTICKLTEDVAAMIWGMEICRPDLGRDKDTDEPVLRLKWRVPRIQLDKEKKA